MESSSKPKVLCTILHQGWIRPELAFSIAAIKNDPRADVRVIISDKRPSETNRNWCAQQALDGGYDFLLTIDHDNHPLANPIDLVFLDLDVVGFAYPSWNAIDPFPIYFVGMDKQEGGYTEHKDKSGLQEVDAVGSGVMLIARRVLEKIQAPFVRKWDENGIATLGLDFYFCEKAKEQGFKVWCHYGYVADHFKELSLLDVLKFKNG